MWNGDASDKAWECTWTQFSQSHNSCSLLFKAAVSWSQLPLSKLILENLPYSMQLLDGLPFVFPSPVVFCITETSHFSIAVHLYTLNSLVEIHFSSLSAHWLSTLPTLCSLLLCTKSWDWGGIIGFRCPPLCLSLPVCPPTDLTPCMQTVTDSPVCVQGGWCWVVMGKHLWIWNSFWRLIQ